MELEGHLSSPRGGQGEEWMNATDTLDSCILALP